MVWDVTAEAVVGNALPTFHIAGANMGLFPLYAGATGSSYPDFDPAGFIDAHRRARHHPHLPGAGDDPVHAAVAQGQGRATTARCS